MNSFYILVIYFSVCSFVGWIIETVYRSIVEKRFVNPGFLYGTFVPIYGFAALFIGIIEINFAHLPLDMRLAAYFLIPTVIEYFTSLMLEKIFNLKLWDYSNKRFNLKGRVCLSFSIMWAVLVIADISFIHPFFIEKINKIPENIIPILAGSLFIYFITDMFLSFGLYKRFGEIRLVLERLVESKSDFKIENILVDNPVLLKIKDVFRPMSAFPQLSMYKRAEMMALIKTIEKKTVGVIKSKIWKKRRERNLAEFNALIHEIISHEEYKKLKYIHHHEHSIYDHCMAVAKLSYKTGRFINKYIKLDMKALTRGALLHDFFLYDWRTTKFPTGKWHAFEHPKEAFNNSTLHFNEITQIEKDIIVKHMWPLNVIPPRYLETVIVVIVDKIVATKEFYVEFFRKKKYKKQQQK